MEKLWGMSSRSAKEKDAKEKAPADKGDKGAGEGAGDGSSTSPAAGDGALVVSGPERKHHKVFVVELGRKPLFPGIYTPVMVTKNERLIKEIMETKKQGGHPYVGAFLRKPLEPPKPGAAGKEAAGGAAADAASSSGAAGKDTAAGAGGRTLSRRNRANAKQGNGGSGGKEAAGGGDGGGDPASHLYEVGTFAQVHTILAGDTADSAQLLLLGHRRIRRQATISGDPLRVHVEHLRDESYTNDDILKATSMELVNTMRDLLHLNPLYGEQFRTLLSLTGSIDLQDMSRLVDAAASLTSADDATLQGVLETLSVPDRARAVLLLLKKEVELCKLQADIREQVEGKIMKEQRRMLLMEQLRSIKKELGLEKDDKSALVQRFNERWEPKKAGAPEEVARVVGDELDKLAGLEPVSPEFNVTRTYLEWLTSLPWGVSSPESFDLGHARAVLDAEHYGLQDVKDRILEFIAVSALRGSAQGKILCLVGPPGVGKTSIGRSIANTLKRAYYRFSVGGLYDVAEIKGHRRTYVGAMPGKMVQCLKHTQTANPLVLIDEIDKLGRGHAGDPASALLELLDPEQNAGFMDHYLDVPVDLSKVLFVCTANVLDTIPGPLLDRMEVIRLSGYTSDEKVAIARTYLEPQAARDAGVPEGAARLSDGALSALINEYCREAGVRNLRKQLEKVYRKVARKLVEGGQVEGLAAGTTATPAPAAGSGDAATPTATDSAAKDGEGVDTRTAAGMHDVAGAGSSKAPGSEGEGKGDSPKVRYTGEPLVIEAAALKEYLGQAPFAPDRFYDSTPPGVVLGLAWTAMGGATLYIEAARVVDGEARGALTTTGQLGDVFRESASIAHTYARTFLGERDPHNKFFSTSALHLHVPQGATPKDGPSAGITMTTALLSLALGRPVAPDTAMTGEVTLTGRLLPIGGVKEKLLAARRAGVKQVIFPAANKPDFDELTDDLKQGVTPHFCATYDEVFKLALEYCGPIEPKPAPAPKADAAAPAQQKA